MLNRHHTSFTMGCLVFCMVRQIPEYRMTFPVQAECGEFGSQIEYSQQSGGS